MNRTIELSSGKIIDLDRFVALIPSEKATDETYSLILEGSVSAIALNSQEAESIKQRLHAIRHQEKNGTWDPKAQLEKNQIAIALLKKRIARNKQMSDAESEQRAEFLANFKQAIDEQRITERKLYS